MNKIIKTLKEANYTDKKYLGNSRKRLEVLILRDPFNLFASLLESQMMKKNYEDKHKYMELYKGYGREYLQQSQSKNIHRVYVNYNQWFLSQEYRINLAEKLGFTTSGEPYEKVAHQGKGSSFDELKLKNNATQMKVIERWKNYKNDEFYRGIFMDKFR